eukprot:3449978-Karenia_brevis.AAC.1
MTEQLQQLQSDDELAWLEKIQIKSRLVNMVSNADAQAFQAKLEEHEKSMEFLMEQFNAFQANQSAPQ